VATEEETREERRRAEWLRRNAELRERNPFIHHAQQIFLYNRYRIAKAINPDFEDWRITDVDLNTGEYLTPNLRAIREFYSTNRTEAIRSKMEDRFIAAFDSQGEPSMLPEITVRGTRASNYPAYEQRLFDAESFGGDPTAASETSSATGMYQMTRGTYNLLQNKLRRKYGDSSSNPYVGMSFEEHLEDPETQMYFGRLLQDDNREGLRNRRLPVNARNMYAAHHFGINKVAPLLNAPADAPVTRVLDRNQINDNPHLFTRQGQNIKTVGELNAWIIGKMGDLSDVEIDSPPYPFFFTPDLSIDTASMVATPGKRSALIPGAMQGPETLQ